MKEDSLPATAAVERSLTITTARPELRRLSSWLQETLSLLDVPPDVVLELDVVLQEAVANVASHGFGDAGEHPVEVSLRRSADRIELEIVDGGRPFDPVAYELAPLPKRLEEVTPGGNGIRLIRRFTDEIRYRRDQEHNRTLLVRRLGTERRG
jgi:anti-sigma regulatory factor (Ser/Thr protein kinase)